MGHDCSSQGADIPPDARKDGGAPRLYLLKVRRLTCFVTHSTCCSTMSCPELSRSESAESVMQDINGAFQPGVLTALVGVSGAGKTTLMDCLAGVCALTSTPRVGPWALAHHCLAD